MFTGGTLNGVGWWLEGVLRQFHHIADLFDQQAGSATFGSHHHVGRRRAPARISGSHNLDI